MQFDICTLLSNQLTINSGTIRLDMVEKEMERHTYTKLGEDCFIA